MNLRDNSDTDDQHDIPEENQKPNYGGFLEMITSPATLGASSVRRPGAIIATAILIYALSFSFAQIIKFSSPELVDQQKQHEMKMTEKFLSGREGVSAEMLEEQLDGIVEKWEDPVNATNIALGMGAGIVMGLAYIFIFGGVFWFFVRIMVESPPHYFTIAAIVAYGAGIAALEALVTTLMAVSSGSLMFTPSPAIFLGDTTPGQLNPSTAILGFLNFFDIWKYLVVGLAVAVHSGLAKTKGLIFGLIAFLIVFAVFSASTIFGSMMGGA